MGLYMQIFGAERGVANTVVPLNLNRETFPDKKAF